MDNCQIQNLNQGTWKKVDSSRALIHWTSNGQPMDAIISAPDIFFNPLLVHSFKPSLCDSTFTHKTPSNIMWYHIQGSNGKEERRYLATDAELLAVYWECHGVYWPYYTWTTLQISVLLQHIQKVMCLLLFYWCCTKTQSPENWCCWRHS